MIHTDMFTIEGYKIHSNKRIGAGAFGEVYVGQSNTTKEEVAVKIIDTRKISLYELNKIKQNEIQLVKNINHPNIVSIIDTRENANFFYIILEKCDIDLDKFIQIKQSKKQKFNEQIAGWIIFQICQAFKHLQKLKILHRDLKPGNILIKNGVIKVADFGLSKQINTHSICNNTARTGTPHYMAYEVLKGKPYTDKCDVWSLGCIFYVLLHGQLPWCMLPEAGMIMAFQNYDGQTINIPRQELSWDMRNFIQSCLRIKEHDRPSWKLLLSLSFFRNQKQLIKNSAKYQQQIQFQLQNCNKYSFVSNDPSSYAYNNKDLAKDFQQIQLTNISQHLKNPMIYIQQKKILKGKYELNKDGNIFKLVHSQCQLHDAKDFYQYDWSKLEELHLDNNCLKSNQNLKLFFQMSIFLPSLKRLQITSMQTQFGDEGIFELIKCKKSGSFKKLVCLQLRYNNITYDGIKHFAQNADSFNLLQELNFSGSKVGAEGIKSLSACVDKLSRLKKLVLYGCQMDFKEMQVLSENAQKLKNIETFGLGYNKIGNKQLTELCRQAHKFQNLQRIYLENNNIGDQGWKSIVKQGHRFVNLRWICLQANKITQIKEDDLKSFSKLSWVTFGLNQNKKNPLISQSKKILTTYKKEHPNVTVDFYEQ